MPNTQPPRRRSGSRKVGQDLLQQRAGLLKQYYRVSEACAQGQETTVTELLPRFCQNLVDYVALGHFALYDRIARGGERRQRIRDLTESLYPKIIESTDKAVSFSDRYARETDNFSLRQDLSVLGEMLASRIAAEDQLLAELVTGLNFPVSATAEGTENAPAST